MPTNRLYDRKGVWWAYGYYWRDGARKRWRRSTGVRNDGTRRSEALAEQIAYQIGQTYATGGARPPAQSLKKGLKALVTRMETAGRAEDTVEIVMEKSVHLLAYFGPGYDLHTLSAGALAKYAQEALRVRKPGTVHRELRTLRQACRAIDIEPPRMPDLGRIYKPRERWLPGPERAKLLAALPAKRREYVTCYLHMGLSKSELYRIERADIDWAEGYVRVRGTKRESRDRVLPMTPTAQAILGRRSRAAGPLFEPWGNADRDLRKAAKRAGLDPVSFNDLRRTFATELAADGVSPLHLQKLMGHRDTRMLEQVYARVERGEHMHRAVARMEDRDTYVPDSADATDTADDTDSEGAAW